ncbi:MAG: hypothetical protein ACRDDF_11445, partial [Aeromonas sp.]
ATVTRLLAQPAIETFLRFFIHYHHPRVEWRKTILAVWPWQPCKLSVLKMFDGKSNRLLNPCPNRLIY